MRKRAKEKAPVDRVLKSLVNVLSLVYAHFYFPTYSNGLKEVGGFESRLLTQTESAREFPAIFRRLMEMLLRFPTRVQLKRVTCGAKIASFLAKNASFPQ
jgi:hypothetical protein